MFIVGEAGTRNMSLIAAVPSKDKRRLSAMTAVQAELLRGKWGRGGALAGHLNRRNHQQCYCIPSGNQTWLAGKWTFMNSVPVETSICRTLSMPYREEEGDTGLSWVMNHGYRRTHRWSSQSADVQSSFQKKHPWYSTIPSGSLGIKYITWKQ